MQRLSPSPDQRSKTFICPIELGVESLFACLAIALQAYEKGEIEPRPVRWYKRHARRLRSQCRDISTNYPLKQEDIWKTAAIFRLSISVYAKFDNGRDLLIGECPTGYGDDWPALHLYQGAQRYSVITDLDTARELYRCSKCFCIFNERCHLRRHENNGCHYGKLVRAGLINADADLAFNVDSSLRVKSIFRPQIYRPNQTLLQRLQNVGIRIPKHLGTRICIWRLCYDIECLLKTVPPPLKLTGTLRYLQENIPVSIAAASNIPGFELRTFLNVGNEEEFLPSFVQYLLTAAKKMEELARERYAPVLQQLDALLEAAESGSNASRTQRLRYLKRLLDQRLGSLDCWGFFSRRFDLNCLIRVGFAFYLQRATDSAPMVIKDSVSGYILLATPQLRFLDISSMLPAKISLRHLMALYNVEADRKLIFPHGFLKEFDDLWIEDMPPYEAFHNSITGRNALEEGRIEFDSMMKEGASEATVLKHLRLPAPPPTGPQLYEQLVLLWKDKGFQNMADYLLYYNSLDVIGLVEVVEKMQQEFQAMGLESESFISLPSMSFPFLLKRMAGGDTTFFVSLNQEIFQEVRLATRGGYSAAFNRVAIKHCTRLNQHKYGDEAPVVRHILQWDQTGLYSYCIGERASSVLGHWSVRRAETRFKVENVMNRTLDCLGWLAFNSKFKYQKEIRSILNPWGEKKLKLDNGKRVVHVDGWLQLDGESGIVFEYVGCFTHGSPCHNQPDGIHPLQKRPNKAIWTETLERLRLIEEHPHVVKLVWRLSCDVDAERRGDPVMHNFMLNYSCGADPVRPTMSEVELLDLIQQGRLHGLVRADFSVPEHLIHRFVKWPPFITNTEVRLEQLDPFQRRYAEHRGLMKEPRRTMVQLLSVRNHLALTENVRWYLDHGLKVENVTLFVQFQQRRGVFSDWLNEITTRRKQAVAEGDMARDLAAKLLANSAYGTAGLRMERRLNTSFATPKNAARRFNRPEAVSRHEAGPITNPDLYYEMSSRKRTVFQRLPLQFAFEIQEISKLRMLELIYDCFDECWRDDSWAILGTDTDSVTLALAEERPIDLCKPEKRAKFENICNRYIVPEDGPLAKELSKQPGLVKLEMENADVCVALASKLYLLGPFGNYKLVHKGWPARGNQHLTQLRAYLDELYEYERMPRATARVAGIRARQGGDGGGGLFTYEMQRKALTALNCKMRYCANGVCYYPLDLSDEMHQRLFPYSCDNSASNVRASLAHQLE